MREVSLGDGPVSGRAEGKSSVRNVVEERFVEFYWIMVGVWAVRDMG